VSLYYLDTSALVKLYVREPGTDRLLRIAGAGVHTLAVLALTRVEVRAAVRRRERMGDLPSEVARKLIDKLEAHFARRYLTQPLTEAVLEEAVGLIDRYPLRAYDALQLAGCLKFRSASVPEVPCFVCADHELLAAAEKERLSVLDPATGPD